MKKTVIINLALSVVALLAGCNKENASMKDKEPMRITASIEETDNTKVAIATTNDEVNGIKQVTWVSGDNFAVWSPLKSDLRPIGSAFPTVFSIDEESISLDGKTADFTEDVSQDWQDAGACIAIYGKRNSVDGWYRRTGGSGGNSNALTLELANTQRLSNGNPETDYLFMKSQKFTITGTDYSGLSNLTFTPVVSIVKVPVKNTGTSAVLDKITLTGSEGYFSGAWAGYRVFTNEGYQPMQDDSSWNYLENGSASVNMVIQASMTSSVKYYYIVVWPGDHGTLTVTLMDDASNTKLFTLSGTFTTEVGKIHRLPVLDWNSKAL